MASEYIEPLNLQYIFQNILAGSPDIFFGLFMILFSILAGTFRLSGRIFLLLYLVASVLLYAWIGGGLFIMVTLVGGIIIFTMLKRPLS